MNQNWCIKSWFAQKYHPETKMVTSLWQTRRGVKDIARNQVRTELLRCTDIDLLPLITAYFLTFIISTWALMRGTHHKTNSLSRTELLLPESLMLTWSYSFQTVVRMEHGHGSICLYQRPWEIRAGWSYIQTYLILYEELLKEVKKVKKENPERSKERKGQNILVTFPCYFFCDKILWPEQHERVYFDLCSQEDGEFHNWEDITSGKNKKKSDHIFIYSQETES